MANRWSHRIIDPNRAGPEFWERYHAFRRARQAETRPDDPIEPDEVTEMQMKREDPFNIRYRYEVTDGEKMLSFFRGSVSRPGTPEYESNKHLFWVDWSVDKEHRRRGIGRSWIPLALELMERHGCTTFSAGTEEEPGHAFLKWLGAKPKLTGAENRLRLADVDWEMAQRWVDEGVKKSPDTKVEIFDGRVPKELWDDYCPQITTMLNTMPWENMDHGDIVVTPQEMEEWYARMDLAGVVHHTMWTREPDGVISGITDTEFFPYRPTIISQGFTGVRTDARGRGLGKWLKAKMLLHMRELYPAAEWVATDNAGSNAPMLAINKKLGFKQFRAASEYQMTRDELASRLKQLAPVR
jgi:GNAT superfamily N-acetyltransferase